MFNALMAVQWKWTKGAALLATIIGFGLPIWSVQSIDLEHYGPGYVVARMQSFGVAYALLAGMVGLAFALLAWSADHRGRHVYALTLPVSRARYAAMRFGSGAVFLLLPALGVLAGCVIGVVIANVPNGLHGYPVALALRFFLASAVAFSIFFAVAASTARAAGVVLGGVAAVFFLAFALSAASVDVDVLGKVSDFLFTQPGPLSVFTGRWMLIDA